MGRSIDRLAITILATFILYLLFISATGRILPALAMTFFAMALLRKLFIKLPLDAFGKKRRALQKARNTLELLSLSDSESAHELLKSLISRAYPLPDETAFEYILRHPSLPVTANEIAELWKRHRDDDRVVVIALPDADAHAVSLAARLKTPEIAVIDGGTICRLLAADDAIIEPDSTYIKGCIPERRRTRIFRAASRARTGKCTLTGIFMLGIYLITGALPYLLGSVILLFIAGLSIRRRHMPKELFGQ